MITNSAGFTGATPIFIYNLPRSRVEGGLFSSSIFTKNASFSPLPNKPPSRQIFLRNASISLYKFDQRIGELGSNTDHAIFFTIDFSI